MEWLKQAGTYILILVLIGLIVAVIQIYPSASFDPGNNRLPENSETTAKPSPSPSPDPVVDPPRFHVQNQTIWDDETLAVTDFISSGSEQAGVSFRFQHEPPFGQAGHHVVIILAEDEFENQTVRTANLTILSDDEPPVISGVSDQVIELGSTISYLRGVSVSDNRDESVELIVDNSQVFLTQPGVYTVVYRAVDSSGNQAEVEATITVLEFLVDPDVLEAEAQQVLDKIIRDEMTLEEKAYAIFRHVRGNISYIGHSDKSSMDNAAYDGLINGYGDCFTYFAVSRQLLTQIGIENLRIERTPGLTDTRHYWNLVNLGDGWYHFDSTPHNRDYPFNGFMRTDAEVAAYYTARHGYDYYAFDPDLYPATPAE